MNLASYHAYLVSDFTGETVEVIAKSVFAQLPLTFVQHLCPLISSKVQINELVSCIQKTGGFIIATIADKELQEYLSKKCSELNIPFFIALAPIIDWLAQILQISPDSHHSQIESQQMKVNREYRSRMESVEYTLTHDDGQNTDDLDKGNIIIFGVSRTSKSPTSLYLAYRGYKVANIPFVLELGEPLAFNKIINNNSTNKNQLIVGLFMHPENLVGVRLSRITLDEGSIQNSKFGCEYANIDNVILELEAFKRICIKYHWPMIDVTGRSIEETAAIILKYYNKLSLSAEKNSQP